MRHLFKFFQASAIIAVASFAAGAAAQESYPSRTIRIIVGTAAGGSSDVSARVLATQLQADLKQPVIVENRAGASGAIAATYVSKSPPDGYTILWGTGSTNVIAPAMTKDIAYDPVKDFTPIVFVGRAPFVMITGRDSKLRTLSDVVAAAKARPGQVTFGTTGPATVYEIAALTLESQANVKFNHIPYKGFVPLQVDVSSGIVDVAVGPIDGFVKSDKVHVVAALGPKRAAELPGTPSAGESGMPGFDVPVWAAMWTSPNTPRAIVQTLHASLRKALARKDVQDAIQATGIFVEPGDDAMLRKTVEDQFEAVKALMRKNGLQPQ